MIRRWLPPSRSVCYQDYQPHPTSREDVGQWEVQRGREKGYLGGREGAVERWVVACLLENKLKNS